MNCCDRSIMNETGVFCIAFNDMISENVDVKKSNTIIFYIILVHINPNVSGLHGKILQNQ